ncbi:MAG: hypothetical protein HOE90_21530 [Bacteriovoracaceae bacterium]|jgi:hypothetical protein|nr:hypothetical protein [Bacteriovoracaceae bacterium]
MAKQFLWIFPVSLLLLCASCGGDSDKNEYEESGQYSQGSATLSTLFDVAGARAVLSVGGSSAGSDDIIKIYSSGGHRSIFRNIHHRWDLRIAALEVGPDGSLYIGLNWGVWIVDDLSPNRSGEIPDFSASPAGQSVALFRIRPNGQTEVVDPDISGIRKDNGSEMTNYSPIQFDRLGNVYYLGQSGGTNVLKMKTPSGGIQQIGNARMNIRDYRVSKEGRVVFHGNNEDDWNSEWLRIYNPDSSVTNVYYRNGSGWLRSYYIDHSGNIILVGEALTMGSELTGARKYNGIIKASVDGVGKVYAIDVLYSDYSANINPDNLIENLLWGFWNNNHQLNFFKKNTYGGILDPLQLDDDMTNRGISEFIKSIYYNSDSLLPGLDEVDFSLLASSRLPRAIKKEWFSELLNSLDDKSDIHFLLENYSLELDYYRYSHDYGSSTDIGRRVASIFRKLEFLGLISLDPDSPSEDIHNIETISSISEVLRELVFSLVPEDAVSLYEWRKDNGLNGVRFSWAKQLISSENGSMYAVMGMDQWGAGEGQGDRLYQILGASGVLELKAFTSGPDYSTIKAAKFADKRMIYISTILGTSKILSQDLDDHESLPLNLTNGRGDIEIFDFAFRKDQVSQKLIYDVYDLSNNTSYFVEQNYVTREIYQQNALQNISVSGVLSFEAN